MAASTPALPPTYLHGRPTLICSCCFRCEAGHLWPFVLRPEPGGESAGCVSLQLPCSAGFVFCLPCHLCLPCPLPSSTVCPRSFCFILLRLPPVSFHVRQDHRLLGPAVCKLQDCPVGSCNTGLQWRPVRRVHFDFFFLQSP